MFEYIRNVKMNYSFYNGQDNYSDGEIEDELLDIVKNKYNIGQILKEDRRWPILYHLSPTRHNLLEWFPFNKNGNVLEIGAGCGAITGLLCEKTKSVTCIELSKKRALINAYRHLDQANLEIIIGNLNDIELTKKYDYITLIGVLEYAAVYTDTNSPYLSFLNNIKDYLKEDGVLIVAIENKFGLKYWAGSREDHTGEFFDSIQNYPSSRKISTFTRFELENLLKIVGFEKVSFYYPYPDYKLPTQIYSDDRLPCIGEIKSQNYNYDQSRMVLFDEESVMNNIIQNDLFSVFSNSYLVFCSV
ncbi:class I SAM-dependent methyltransferase [Paenibacillus oralis]|uniref:Class I SAM-dependent methyltransferase n=1 Tax=Paenibacillus oralis TaxID=2490856 RepID=A0A3P3TVN9_9BACL|nr:class I SAM-dependent methyltransferase [Paenibacillus oralis]RRJ62207.1 class I SAM-dependent methyltransferase [Paenibacillus oralis]